MTRPRDEITADMVRDVLDYDPATGIFRWRTDRTGGSFKTPEDAKAAYDAVALKLHGEFART